MARILYFATLVEKLGRTREDVQLPGEVTDVRAFLAWLKGRGEPWKSVLAAAAVRITVNKQFADLATKVTDADEIAVVPAKF